MEASTGSSMSGGLILLAALVVLASVAFTLYRVAGILRSKRDGEPGKDAGSSVVGDGHHGSSCDAGGGGCDGGGGGGE